MTNNRIPPVSIENARITFRNFAGKAKQYNELGKRNFVILLEPDIATDLIEQGWNVKQLRPREEGDTPQDYISVAISYNENARPPKVVMVSSRSRTSLSQDELEILDYAEINNVDVIIRGYQWEVNGKTGIKAYLQSIYVTIEEDQFAEKYADVPDSRSEED